MHCMAVGLGLLVVFLAGATAGAQDSDLAAGETLYLKHCKVCHGMVSTSEASHRWHAPLPMPPVRLTTRLPHGLRLATTAADLNGSTVPRPYAMPPALNGPRVAFAPPFGPNLRGVYGRRAGSVKGFDYSRAFLDALQGVEWNYGTLEVWLTNTQAWVPGVRMFYKQPDPEIRRKIILYLKANP